MDLPKLWQWEASVTNLLLHDGEYQNDVQAPDVDPIEELREQFAEFSQRVGSALALLNKRVDAITKGMAYAISETSSGDTASAPSRNSAIWDSWKQRLGPTCGRFIDALLEHGSLNGTQLAIITKCGRQNVATYIHRLNKANLINKNGGLYSLKQI